MSPHPDESGPEPDDRLFVRPYVAGPGSPHGPAYPAWPTLAETPEETTQPLPRVPSPAPAGPVAGAPRHTPGRRRSPLPLAVLALAVVAVGAGAAAFLMSGPEPESTRAAVRPDLELPALPARSPGAGEPDVRSKAAPAKPSASASTRGPSASPSSAKPSPSPSAGTSRPAKPAEFVTLRPGDKGPEVRALQQRLYDQGFTYVHVNGVYDGQTKRGVSQLQRDRDIKGDPNGVYGPATQAAFG
ncbi:peptidoglycan-binding protein [Streptomyces sp. NPDC005180]|uniref:peptidoglycan-binding domain-containing protein n=1 Tax=Streptomyces sp. NPDC005180 TaxID=3156868 RepID=UPI0033B05CE2